MQDIAVDFPCILRYLLVDSALPLHSTLACWSSLMRKPSGKVSVANVRVFVAESSQLNCQLVERALRPKRNRIDVIGSAVQSGEALAFLQENQPDIAVVSAHFQDGALAGYRFLREVRTVTARTRSVMLLHSREHELIVDAFRCGARGVVFRDEPLEVLCKCIHAVHHGQVWANSETMRYIIDALSKTMPVRLRDPRRVHFLSKREADIARLVAEGLNNEDISVELEITEHTVRNNLFHIFEKIGVSTRVELVLYWLQRPSDGSSAESALSKKAATAD